MAPSTYSKTTNLKTHPEYVDQKLWMTLINTLFPILHI